MHIWSAGFVAVVSHDAAFIFGCLIASCPEGAAASSQTSEVQEIDVEKKLALCRTQIAYEDGRRPQFEVSSPLGGRVGPALCTFTV